MDAKEIVRHFWHTMGSNDFTAASECLTEDYELLWPQSSERIVGRANFAALNTNYPAHGIWKFTINSLVAEENTVVSDVSVTDGVVHARVITFSTLHNGLIAHQTEFWPDEYEAPAWRKAWVQPL